jgi:hypothetical protein
MIFGECGHWVCIETAANQGFLSMVKRSATYHQTQLSRAIIQEAQKAGATQVEVDMHTIRIVVTFRNSEAAGLPNGDGGAPLVTSEELRKLL